MSGPSFIIGNIAKRDDISYDNKDDSYHFTTKVLRDWWLRYYDLVEV